MFASQSPMSTQDGIAFKHGQYRGQKVFVTYIQSFSDLQSCHVHLKHHACFYVHM